MDPLTAIGLVSNILSFIEFSVRLLKGAKEVHGSQNGVLKENRSRETIVRDMQRMSTRMLVSDSPEEADDNASLCILGRECHELSVQLISLLEKIKPKDSGSTTQSLVSALRNKNYDSERAGLEARLSDCRAQLHLELSNLTRTETLEKLESLLQASKLDETKLDRIERHIAQLRESISLAPSTSEAKPMLMRLLAEEEKVFTTIAQDRILKCLSFEGMDRRSNMVVETHSNTYEWILEDNSATENSPEKEEHESTVEEISDQRQEVEDIEKVRARDKLRTWLESTSSRDVFHLSGKLGSGKSTLMKHIRSNPRTEERLNAWADGRKLTIASFYFWNIGSEYEKSLQGLYASLLHQIFTQCPELISKAWPAKWARANSAPWFVPKEINISRRNVIEALVRVIDSHDLLESHCFAFFIDGLDEFESTVQDDHRDLVELLCQWAANDPGNVKICASSRPYPVFMDSFTPTLRIRLQDLTSRDMNTYIRDKLAHASADESFEDLVSLIMNKANGVFLWVALVVKSLREGLENGMSCSNLRQEVDVLPEELEQLYKHILMSMGRSARMKAYQTFSMVTELKKYHVYKLSLLAYSFFEEYGAGQNFFMKKSNSFPMNSLIGARGKERAQSSSRKLAGWCKGLVEPYKMSWWDTKTNPCKAAWQDWSLELDFAHRSISEFLESDEVRDDIQLTLRAFDHVDAVLNLIVSDVLYENATSVQNTSRSGITTAVFLEIMERYDLIREPYTYLTRMRELMIAGKVEERLSPNTKLLLASSTADGDYVFSYVGKCMEVNMDDTDKPDETPSSGINNQMTKRHYMSDPLHRMVKFGHCDYALWHLANNSDSYDHPDSLLTLACLCLDEAYGLDSPDNHQPLMVLEAMFQKGWLSPNTITKLHVARYEHMWLKISGSSSDLSLWHQLMIKVLGGRYYPTKNPSLLTTDEYVTRRSQYDGKLLQLFLRFKCDTKFSFSIWVNEETTTTRRVFLLKFDEQGLLLTTTPPDKDFGDAGWRRPWEESDIGLPSENGAPATRHFSLRDFIELSLFNNKDELLRMLDEQSKPNIDSQARKFAGMPALTQAQGCVGEERISEEIGLEECDTTMSSDLKLAGHSKSQSYLGDAFRWIKHLLANGNTTY